MIKGERRREMTESQTQTQRLARDVFIISPTSTLLQCLLLVMVISPPAPPRQWRVIAIDTSWVWWWLCEIYLALLSRLLSPFSFFLLQDKERKDIKIVQVEEEEARAARNDSVLSFPPLLFFLLFFSLSLSLSFPLICLHSLSKLLQSCGDAD